MNWYNNYVAYFFAAAFLANFVPHFFHGISGDRFPTSPTGRAVLQPLLERVCLFRARRRSSSSRRLASAKL
jgi:hypothetical protein